MNAKKAGPKTVPKNNTAITNVQVRAPRSIGIDHGMIANRIKMRSKVMSNLSSFETALGKSNRVLSPSPIIHFNDCDDSVDCACHDGRTHPTHSPERNVRFD
ncbi:hypothetical protein RISK_006776 [Rhodopirellula islandica]|uniref:Uncharacterized protein n=1 Tax=Rhodopirellula islandica TaxID=595434 RepID=A0A0J1B356_RHOIS|nr:hypothetical protein RISK_006776 [Rhodopirellula islandica]